MNDSQHLANSRELTLKQLPRHDKLPAPVLAHVASPSPAKARRRPATERPSLPTANVAPVKLPSELFAIATSRSCQGDLALSKALDGIQAAATRLETERAKLVIQSQELQIWDMAREEELVLLRAENEQMEQQLAAVAEKVGKGQGRDGVLDSLQFALRKARLERDAEMREADSLFNQLQEAKAAAMEFNELRAAFSAALSSLKDDWSAVPLLAEEARELRARADAAAQDPTNLGRKDMATLLRGLLALASRGAELQRETQTLRGEKAALQQQLDAANEQLQEQSEAMRRQQQELSRRAAGDTGRRLWGTDPGGAQPSGSEHPGPANGGQQDRHHQQVVELQQQVSELQAKVAEYRSYLEDNQGEIEGLQAELKRLRQAQGESGSEADAQNLVVHLHSAAPRGGPHRYGPPGGRNGVAAARGPLGTSVAGGAAAATTHASDPFTALRRLKEQLAPLRPHQAAQEQQPQQVPGTPTRHVLSSSSPISTVNYGGSPPMAIGSPNRGSPMSHKTAADIACKVAELQELALRAQQQASEREADLLRQHEAQLAALRQQLAQQNDAEVAELTRQHARAVSELEAQRARLESQYAQARVEVQAQTARLTGHHAQRLAEREAELARQHAEALARLAAQAGARLAEREAELERQHTETLAHLAAQAEARLAGALAEQAATLAQQHARELREAEDHRAALHAARLKELEERLCRHFAEQQAARDVEARHKHEERLAEQAAQLARLHAEQAAQLGASHAEAIAEREAQLLDEFERQLEEREAQLADDHADQLRDAEARFAAAAAEAADEREAQLEARFTERLASALRQHQEVLAAQADARLQSERAGMRAAAARLEEDARRRERELAMQLEEQRRRVEELERRMLRVQITVGERPASPGEPRVLQVAVASAGSEGAADGAEWESSEGTVAAAVEEQDEDVSAAGAPVVEVESSGATADGAHSEVSAAEGVEEEGAAAAAGDPQLQQLARQSEQLQRYADELEAVFDEAERRRQEAVAEVERQYADVVSRLAREHEKAVTEARTAHELRESNLRKALERQAQEARDAEQQHSEQLKQLKDQMVELRNLLMEERQRHSSSNTTLEERAAQLAAELEATRRRETEVLHDLAFREQQAAGPAKGTRAPAPSMVSFASMLGSALTAGGIHTAPSTGDRAGAAADAWSDGQDLPWPASSCAPVHGSRSSTVSGGDAAAVAGGSPGRSRSKAVSGGDATVGVGGSPTRSRSSTLSGGGAAATAGGSPGRSRTSTLSGGGAAATAGGSPGHSRTSTLSGGGAAATAGGSPGRSRSSTLSGGDATTVAGGSTSSAGPLLQVAPVSEAATSQQQQQQLVLDELARSSEPDLASNLLRVLRVMVSVNTGGPGARLWGSSIELDTRAAPRQELLGARSDDDAATAQPTQPNTDPAAGRPAGWGGGGRTAGNGSAAQRGTEIEWGELVSAPPPPASAAAAAPQQRRSAAGTSAPSAAAPARAGGGAAAGGGPGYISEAATSVSTDTEYNSETEFYVDDEDDEEHRGRALAAALAKSPSAAPAELQRPLPPALEEMQRRRRAQSAAPAVAATVASSAIDAASSAQTVAGSTAGSAAQVSGAAAAGGSDGDGGRGGSPVADVLEASLSQLVSLPSIHFDFARPPSPSAAYEALSWQRLPGSEEVQHQQREQPTPTVSGAATMPPALAVAGHTGGNAEQAAGAAAAASGGDGSELRRALAGISGADFLEAILLKLEALPSIDSAHPPSPSAAAHTELPCLVSLLLGELQHRRRAQSTAAPAVAAAVVSSAAGATSPVQLVPGHAAGNATPASEAATDTAISGGGTSGPRGRGELGGVSDLDALEAALAQLTAAPAMNLAHGPSPSAAHADLPRLVPFLLEQLQHRRRTQSIAAPAPDARGDGGGASTAGLDLGLEATLAGPFPMLPQSLPVAQHRRPQLPPLVVPGKARAATPGGGSGGGGSPQQFTFAEPQRSGPGWNGMRIGGGSPLAGAAARRGDDRNRTGDVSQQALDLVASFDFSPTGQARSPRAATAAAAAASSKEPSDQADGSPVAARRHRGPDMLGSSPRQGEPQSARGDGLHGASGRRGGEGGRSPPGSGNSSPARGSPSGLVPQLPPLMPRQSPKHLVWVDIMDDGDSGEDDGAFEEADGGRDDQQLAADAFPSPRLACGAARAWSPAATRPRAGMAPVMLPNPLYEGGGEVSPPWSTADWNAGAASPLEHELVDDGPSLPSTPASGSSEGNGDSGNSDDWAGTPISATGAAAGQDASCGAWDAPYDLPYDSSPPDWDCSPAGRDQADAPAGVRRTLSSSGGRRPAREAVEGPVEEEEEEELSAACKRDIAEEEEPRRKRGEDSPDDDLRSLLAAGATLSSTERRRRQRRRMGDAPVGVQLGGHPIDLLRQGWEFAGGVASPISMSPRSAPRQGSPLDLVADPWVSPSPRQQQQRAATPPATVADLLPLLPLFPSEEDHQHQRDAQLQQLLPLQALQRGRSSPSGPRRCGVTSPSPRTSPLRPQSASPLALGGRAISGSPRTPPRSPRSADVDQSAAAPVALVPASPGRLFRGTASPRAMTASGVPMSPLEARQRSRALLGRAKSRVAELEGQCRALAAAMRRTSADGAADTNAAADGAPPAEGAPDRRSLPATPERRRPGSPFAPPESSSAEMDARGSYGGGALVLAQPPSPPQAAPAKVVDALEDLRGDLGELEALHRLTMRLAARSAAAAAGGDGGPGGGAMSKGEPRQAVMVLAGQAGGAVAAAAAAAAAAAGSGERAHARSPPSTVAPPVADGGGGGQGPQGGQPSGSPRLRAGDAASPRTVPGAALPSKQPGGGAPGWPPSATEPSANPSRRAGALVAELGAEASPSSATAAAAAAAVAAQRGTPVSAAMAGSPVMPSLDPALVALLQMSIQAQVQGQLGQLESRIAELQRQNEALLSAATAASTPATPLPPQSMAFRHGGPVGAAVTPLLPATPLSTAGTGVGGAESGRGRWAEAVGRAASGDAAALSWSGGGGGGVGVLWSQSGRGGGAGAGMWPPREAWPVVTAAWESTPSLAAAAAVSGCSQSHARLGSLPISAASAAVVLPLAGTPALTPAQAGLNASALADVLAGPFSPEELSQLPPGVQLFAPPQLRAAALAAVREHSQGHRRGSL